MTKCATNCRYFNSHSAKSKTGDCMVRPNRCIRVRDGMMRGAILTLTDEVSAKTDCPHGGPYRGNAEYVAPSPPKAESEVA